MFQHHPLDANGKLLRRFYEPLTLLRVLDPTRGAQRPDLILDRGLEEQSKLWRNFLDQLAFLCDSEKGGDTVAAVAAQKTAENTIFWVASNSKSRSEAHEHLCWVLARLNEICAANLSTVHLEREITWRCINFSLSRIKTYTNWLMQAIREAKRNMNPDANTEDATVWNELEHLENLKCDPHQLCSFAHSLRRHGMMDVLYRRHVVHSHRGVWSDMRHYIGRLGMWTKAIRILILGTKTFPQRIENSHVEVIGPHGSADLPNKLHITDLHGVVSRVVPADQFALLAELKQALADANAVVQIWERFRDDYSNIRPRPHAELLVLEHFYSNELEFVANDKYIGCSKPSCYCCHMYMQCHPGGFPPRPCHGNLWINWAPPIPLPLAARKTKRTTARPQEHHTFKLLQKMLVCIRRDLQEQILSRKPKRSKLPDSTTGMSSVLFETDSILGSTVRNFVQSNESHQSDRSINPESAAMVNIDSDAIADGISNSSPKSDSDDIEDRTFDMEKIIAEQGQGGRDEKKKNPNGKDAQSESDTDIENEDDEDNEDNVGVLLFKGRKRYFVQARH
ncbi:uncharacterized protein A1O5_10806 [Cladophialophora psammophila CBS 110553]|uniref:Uncharacterized protein n=1 Tax=Cladophialophora psammophila CBS 110553 TaxID=1182543 RepID=W9WMF2_9EURO|nr:uncharacterized protein A1O5_10806 [Cladophialophora psammophila CBS 110553]EXJ66190.1 hypothetical protein A1O5_10806 [Cladophialophora psammophila CBS 110553]